VLASDYYVRSSAVWLPHFIIDNYVPCCPHCKTNSRMGGVSDAVVGVAKADRCMWTFLDQRDEMENVKRWRNGDTYTDNI
jgi:hypothetical protein